MSEKMKTLSTISLPGGFELYEWRGDSLYLANSPQKKEIRLEERKTETAMYIAEGDSKAMTIYAQVGVQLTPVLSDFYIPMHAASFDFYSGLQDRLERKISGEIEKYFNEYAKDKSIPFYPVPLTTLSGVFKYYNFKEFKSTRNKTKLVQKIRIEEDMPAPDRGIEQVVKKQFGSEYGRFKQLLEKAFKDRDVWPIKELEKYFKRNEEKFGMWKWTTVKNILPCIAYTYSTGPWKKLWVRYGYDPRVEPEAYRYQVYMWKNISKAFVIMDRPDIYQKIKNTEQFTQKDFNARTGFLTEAALEYMHKKFSELKVPEPKKLPETTEIFDDLDFETLDN